MPEEETKDQEQSEQEETTEGGKEQSDSEGETEGKNSFRNFVDESARIAKKVGSTLGETFKSLAHIFRGRNHVVMVRVNDESLKRIDQLVDSGIFRSRSESGAFLIAKGIEAEAHLYQRLESKVEEINRLRDELRSMVV